MRLVARRPIETQQAIATAEDRQGASYRHEGLMNGNKHGVGAVRAEADTAVSRGLVEAHC